MPIDTAARVREILARCDALRTDDHFVYTSGRHGSVYVNKDALYPDTSVVGEIGALLAGALVPSDPEIVCGPALGAIVLSQWTAHSLTERTGRPVLSVYAEKTEDGGLVLRRGYDELARGRRVAVVEDVVNTGGSLVKTVEAVRAAGGTVVGAASVVDRGGCTEETLGIRTYVPLLRLALETHAQEECPLCREGVPVNTRLGKGAALSADRDR